MRRSDDNEVVMDVKNAESVKGDLVASVECIAAVRRPWMVRCSGRDDETGPTA